MADQLANIDILEILKVVVPMVVALFGIWRLVITYYGERAKAREQEHILTEKLRADEQAREDTQMQKLTDAVMLLIGQMGTQNANITRLLDQEEARITMRKAEIEKSAANYEKLSSGVTELTASLGKVADDNRRFYQKELNARMDEQDQRTNAQLAEITVLKTELLELKELVKQSVLPPLQDVHSAIGNLATKDDLSTTTQILKKIEAIENTLNAVILKGMTTPPDTPAPPPASAVVDGATAPKPNEAQPAPKQETKV